MISLIALANELVKKYSVIVFFDPSMKKKEDRIRESLDKKVSLNIADKEADYLILDFADLHKDSFIVSNDNYNEFPDKKAKQEGRIIHAEVIDDSISISDLNVMIKYKKS